MPAEFRGLVCALALTAWPLTDAAAQTSRRDGIADLLAQTGEATPKRVAGAAAPAGMRSSSPDRSACVWA